MLHRCAFEGCRKSSQQPSLDGWGYLVAWGSGIPDGHYCREHKEAIEAVHDDIASLQRLDKQ
jgi:hypothetical protein